MPESTTGARTDQAVPAPRPAGGGGTGRAQEELLLIGCGILAEEVRAVLDQRGVRASTCFLPPALHIDPDRLERALAGALDRHSDRPRVVFYGSCHPRMDTLLDAAGTRRTAGQSCVEILLGSELFTEHLLAGAYFLLERWARSWHLADARADRGTGPGNDPGTGRGAGAGTAVRSGTGGAPGTVPDLLGQFMQVGHRYVLGIRTPRSGDFSAQAAAIAARVGLPLRWIDVELTELARRLDETLVAP